MSFPVFFWGLRFNKYGSIFGAPFDWFFGAAFLGLHLLGLPFASPERIRWIPSWQ